jgi:hypothetical protein
MGLTLEPLDPPARRPFAPDLAVLILADCFDHEPDAVLVGTAVNDHAIAEHAMAQQRRRIVEDDQVEPCGRHHATEVSGQPTNDVASIRACRSVFQKETDIDIAVGTLPANRATTKEIRQPYLVQLGDRRAKTLDPSASIFERHVDTVTQPRDRRNRQSRYDGGRGRVSFQNFTPNTRPASNVNPLTRPPESRTNRSAPA